MVRYLKNLAASLGWGDVLANSNTSSGSNPTISAEDKIIFDSSGSNVQALKDSTGTQAILFEATGGVYDSNQISLSADGTNALEQGFVAVSSTSAVIGFDDDTPLSFMLFDSTSATLDVAGNILIEGNATEINIGGGLPINIAAESKIVFAATPTDITAITNGTSSMSIDGSIINLSTDDGSLDESWIELTDTEGLLAFGADSSAAGGGEIQINANETVSTRNGTDFTRISDTGMSFFGKAPVAQPSGVAVTAGGIHAALVSLGLITA